MWTAQPIVRVNPREVVSLITHYLLDCEVGGKEAGREREYGKKCKDLDLIQWTFLIGVC